MFKQVLTLVGTSRKVIRVYPNIIQHQSTQAYSNASIIQKWDLYSAVCLERHPIILQPMQELEQKFYNLLKKTEFENSLKCDHELRIEIEKKQHTLDNKNNLNPDEISIQTAQDFEDNSQQELDNFQFAPTITKFDEQNITSSLKRKLDKNLILLVQKKIGNEYYWIPPQGIRQEGETMRQTAERILQDTCGINIKVKFYGNAPVGFYKYKYPTNLKEKIYGAKVFYFLAKYIDGDITNNIKYQWLDHEELRKILPSKMQKSISQFMLCD